MIQVQLLLIVLLLNLCGFFFFFNDTATTEIYTLSLHDALPILKPGPARHGAKAHAHCPLGASYSRLFRNSGVSPWSQLARSVKRSVTRSRPRTINRIPAIRSTQTR